MKLKRSWRRKFAQADQKARDLAFAKAEALERLAQANRSKVEKSKVAAVHYQDPMDVESEPEEVIVLAQSEVGRLATVGKPSGFARLTTEESRAIRQSHMVGGSKTAPLGKQPAPYIFPNPPPTINGHSLTEFFAEMRQGMAGVWGLVNEMRGEILEIKSQNPSCSSSMTNLPDTSLNLRIGSTLKISEPGSTAVEVMSVTTDG
jgi:hypothetical protein